MFKYRDPVLFFFIEVQLIYNIVLISAIQQSDLVVRVCIYIYIYIYKFLKILFHYGFSQDIECNSPCHAVRPCLFFVYIRFCCSVAKLCLTLCDAMD